MARPEVRRPEGRPREVDSELKVRLPAEVRAWVKYISELSGKSESATVRMLVEQFKETVESVMPRGPRRDDN